MFSVFWGMSPNNNTCPGTEPYCNCCHICYSSNIFFVPKIPPQHAAEVRVIFFVTTVHSIWTNTQLQAPFSLSLNASKPTKYCMQVNLRKNFHLLKTVLIPPDNSNYLCTLYRKVMETKHPHIHSNQTTFSLMLTFDTFNLFEKKKKKYWPQRSEEIN